MAESGALSLSKFSRKCHQSNRYQKGVDTLKREEAFLGIMAQKMVSFLSAPTLKKWRKIASWRWRCWLARNECQLKLNERSNYSWKVGERWELWKINKFCIIKCSLKQWLKLGKNKPLDYIISRPIFGTKILTWLSNQTNQLLTLIGGPLPLPKTSAL